MGYTIIDLIDNFISIEKLGYEAFLKLASTNNCDSKVRTLAKVFASQEKNHIEKYEMMKSEIIKDEGIEIDFLIYDRAVKFIYDFNSSFKSINAENTKEFLQACLAFENENLALATVVQGILVGSKRDVGSQNYVIMSEIIEEENKHVKNIELFLK